MRVWIPAPPERDEGLGPGRGPLSALPDSKRPERIGKHDPCQVGEGRGPEAGVPMLYLGRAQNAGNQLTPLKFL